MNKQRQKELAQKQQLTITDHKSETAWVLGAGNSLNYVWDWEVPPGVVTFALNSSSMWAWKDWENGQPSGVIFKPGKLHTFEQYRRPLDYWFCIDNKVTMPTKQPEWTYANIAMRHPTCKKIFLHSIKFPDDIPNAMRAKMHQDYQSKLNFSSGSSFLMRGPTVLIPCLFYIYRAGFKRVVLSGIDFCRFFEDEYKIRRFWDRPVKDGHGVVNKNHERNDASKINPRDKTRAPDGEWVYQDGMMRNHMNASMTLIRAMQNEGITFYKTGSRGMVSIPFIKENRALEYIASCKPMKTV